MEFSRKCRSIVVSYFRNAVRLFRNAVSYYGSTRKIVFVFRCYFAKNNYLCQNN